MFNMKSVYAYVVYIRVCICPKTKKQFCVAFAKATQTRVSSNIFRKIYMNSCKTHTCAHVVARTFVRLYVAPLSSGCLCLCHIHVRHCFISKKIKSEKKSTPNAACSNDIIINLNMNCVENSLATLVDGRPRAA